MERNVKLLWGVIGFAVLVGFVLPKPDSAAPEDDAAALQAQSSEPAAPPPPTAVQAPTNVMSAEVPTDYSFAAQPTFGEPSGIDGNPVSVDTAMPTTSLSPGQIQPSPPPPPPPQAPPKMKPGSIVLAGPGETGPKLDRTILR